MPNFQTIHLNFLGDHTYELEQIRMNAGLIRHVKEVLVEGKNWRPLELQAYYDCAIAFKESLQSMRFSVLETTITALGGRVGNIVLFLSDFHFLTNLTIANIYYPHLRMVPVIRLCSNLVNIIWNNRFEEPVAEDDNQLQQSKLQYLNLTVPGVTLHQLIYI